MTKRKKIDLSDLKNPPAIEVVFDIRLDEEEGLSAQNFNIAEKNFNERFSKKDDIRFFEAMVGENQSSSRYGIHGIEYKNDNGKELARFNLDGFSYHSLKDYPLWGKFLKNAIYTWKKYKKCRNKHVIKRLGLRYINLIKIPKSCSNLNDYFDVDIQFPKSDVGQIKQYQYRYASDFGDNCGGVINFVQQPISATDQHKSFILDIDIYIGELSDELNDAKLEGYFEKMRSIKNKVFEAHLTDKTLENFL